MLVVWHRVQAQLPDLGAPALLAGVADITAQLDALVGPGFATAAGAARLGDVARYLEAVERRIEKLRADPARDAAWTAQVHVVADEYARAAGRAPAGRRTRPRAAGDPLDDRGAAGEPVRTPDAHPLPDLRPSASSRRSTSCERYRSPRRQPVPPQALIDVDLVDKARR